MPILVLIADGQPLIRAGIRFVLNTDGDLLVAGEACDSEDACRLARRLEPDVLLLDADLPGAPAVETVRYVREECSRTKVVVLCNLPHPNLFREIMAAGVHGYVSKRGNVEELPAAVRTVASGGIWVEPSTLSGILQYPGEEPTRKRSFVLTDRELAVLRLLVSGNTDRVIGQALHISERTVRRRVGSICDKLNVSTRTEVAFIAARLGLAR